MYYFAKSTQGSKSEKNEDFFRIVNETDTPLYLLCDGVGGHPAGDIASRMCCDLFGDFYLSETEMTLTDITHKVNKDIHEYGNTHTGCFKMGTTLCALILKQDTASIVSVGDSRVYLCTPSDFEQLTEDQSPVWDLFAQGEITKDEMITHPRNNIIKGGIGLKQDVVVNSYQIEYPTDKWIFIICSDGLTDVTIDDEIHNTLKGIQTLKEGVDKLSRLAIQNKSRDDITIILVSNYMV